MDTALARDGDAGSRSWGPREDRGGDAGSGSGYSYCDVRAAAMGMQPPGFRMLGWLENDIRGGDRTPADLWAE